MQVLVGGGISSKGFEPNFEVINLVCGEKQERSIDRIPVIEEVHVAGIRKDGRLFVCGEA